MLLLDYWHPVICTRHLKRQPISVKLCERQIVLFLTAQQKVGALDDRCCHRGMRLSRGWVEGERLVCPYHGWSYDCTGKANSPATPKLTGNTPSFDVIERYGAFWIKKSDSLAEFPQIEEEGYQYICTLSHRIRSPLKLVLDNFSEVEHTATVHTFLGYGKEELSKIETQVKASERTVQVTNKGLQKKLPRLIERFLNIRTGDWFYDNWTTYFAPVHIIYDQFWVSQTSGEPRGPRFRIAVFFNPVNETETQLMTFAFARQLGGILGATLLTKLLMSYLIDYEVKQDCQILENLADKKTTLSGLTLGRFDRVLLENRKRIDRIYKGQE